MKRRDFSTHLAATAAWGLGTFGTLPARAQAGAPVEGQNYVKLSAPAPVSLPADKKIEVIEFFWYECGHCFAFDPAVDAWSKRLSPDVAFRRVPVGYTARHQSTQKLYYALEDMGKLDALHKRVFTAIHVNNQRLVSESDQIAFASANGIDGAKFGETLRSFQVATKANRAKQLVEAYKIDGVPAMGVHGRYYTSGSMAGTNERSLMVSDFLIDRVRKPA